MTSRRTWRVWYGRRLGIRQSFEDFDNFDSAAKFAAFIEADRLEIVRKTDVLPAAEVTS